MVRAQGLALLFANVLRTWVDDEDDNTQTLAALDRELARGQRFAGLLDDSAGFRKRRAISASGCVNPAAAGAIAMTAPSYNR